MKVLPLVILTASCVRLSHVDPQPRDWNTARLATVRVTSACPENSGFKDPKFDWQPDREGVGIIVSERHVLTAAHVVACPAVPVVRVHLSDGREWRMVVERDGSQLDPQEDVVRLEIASADSFDLHIPPPTIGGISTWAAWAFVYDRSPVPGHFIIDSEEYAELVTRRGDSGAGVYNANGELVGLVSAGNGRTTQIARVDVRWLTGL